MPDTPLNVALVGYGLAGKIFHAPLITTTPGLRLAAVVSSRCEEIAADLPGTEPVDSLGAALAGGGIDLVVVATPNDSHYPLAAEAIRAGCHVVVDKPFTVTVAQAEALRDQARRSGVLLSVFHNRRWSSDFLAVRRLIETGESRRDRPLRDPLRPFPPRGARPLARAGGAGRGHLVRSRRPPDR